VNRSPDSRVLANVVSLVVCGVLAGVVVAAAAFPALGFTGLTAKAASDSFQNLPAELKTPPLPQRSDLLAADGSLITSFYDENRQLTTLKDIPMVMQHAMVSAEDVRFYEHKGVDMQGVVRAFVANQKAGKVTQGASTLTQQYVKNILKYSAKTKAERDAAEADDAARKLREMRYAVQLEKKYTKAEILDKYLNIAFFGNGGYGAASAAKVYFNKPISKVTLAEAAMLAGMVKSPTQYNPMAGPKSKAKAQDRRNYVLQRMVDQKFVTQTEADAAKKQPINLHPKRDPQSCASGKTEYGYYCDWFLSWWKGQVEFGKSTREREDNLRKGGYKIYTALDPKTQAAAQRSVDQALSRNAKFATGIVLVEPGTGRVKAMAINRTYSLAKNPNRGPYWKAPNSVNPLLTGSGNSPGYQAGSTFKMFTMTAALADGLPLNTRINAPNRYKSIFTGGCKVGGNKYCPKNASPGMAGTHTMWSAFGESVNTYFVQLEEMVTVKSTIAMAERMGVVLRSDADIQIKNAVQKDPNATGGSFTLGTAQVSPLDMANSYATIAARGKRCDPLPLLKLLDRNGKPIAPAAAPRCKQVIPPDVADAAADAARCPVGDPAMSRCSIKNGATVTRVGGATNRQIAGKSGTTDENNAAWFVGFTPNMAGAAFLANPDHPIDTVPNTKIPATVFIGTMKTALASIPAKKFVRPTSLRAWGIRVNVPDVDGFSVGRATSRLTNAGFKVRVSQERIGSKYSAGLVAKTDPGGGESASKGGIITIFLSNGKQPDPKTSASPGKPPFPFPFPTQTRRPRRGGGVLPPV
jgi:membrane peptidoglycan carboxypeptidase